MNIQVVFPVLISFAISVILGPVIIPFLRKLKMGQTERVEGVQSHLKKGRNSDNGWSDLSDRCSGYFSVLCKRLSGNYSSTGF